MHECTECLSTEENPYSTSLCKSHQIELQMQLLEDYENAPHRMHPTAFGARLAWLFFGFVLVLAMVLAIIGGR
jgi:hypothetical protein